MSPRFTLGDITVGLRPSVKLERVQAERDKLYPLFVTLRGKRAFLDYYGRADQPPVTSSIRHVRQKLDDTLIALGPDADSTEWVSRIRDACLKYLTAVKDAEEDPNPPSFAPALRELRTAVRTVALHVKAVYHLDVAAELVDEMDRADREAPEELRKMYEDVDE